MTQTTIWKKAYRHLLQRPLKSGFGTLAQAVWGLLGQWGCKPHIISSHKRGLEPYVSGRHKNYNFVMVASKVTITRHG